MAPGESETIEFEVTQPGDYPFECTFHTALGQVGTMTVSGTAATPTASTRLAMRAWTMKASLIRRGSAVAMDAPAYSGGCEMSAIR